MNQVILLGTIVEHSPEIKEVKFKTDKSFGKSGEQTIVLNYENEKVIPPQAEKYYIGIRAHIETGNKIIIEMTTMIRKTKQND